MRDVHRGLNAEVSVQVVDKSAEIEVEPLIGQVRDVGAVAPTAADQTTRLEVHHVNGDPTDNRIQNTIPLCVDCHRSATFPGI